MTEDQGSVIIGSLIAIWVTLLFINGRLVEMCQRMKKGGK